MNFIPAGFTSPPENEIARFRWAITSFFANQAEPPVGSLEGNVMRVGQNPVKNIKEVAKPEQITVAVLI